MKKKSVLTVINLLAIVLLHAQVEKFDIASFTAPKGWQRLDSNGVVLFQDAKTTNNQLTFCQIYLYPSKASSNNKTKDFDNAWKTLVTTSKKKPKTTTEKTPDGWTAISGAENVSVNGIHYTVMVTSVSGFGKVMNILVNVAGEEYGTAVESFFTHLEFDKNAKPNMTPIAAASGTYDDYIYTAPENWVTQRSQDCIYLIHQEGNQRGCYISLFAPQPSSGNLENDVQTYFAQMYTGWQFLRAGVDVLTKGYNAQGLEYCMMEGSMMKPRGEGMYDYEEGGVILFKTGNRMGIATIRHEATGLYCKCKTNYNSWTRFLNSFTAKNFTPAPSPVNPSASIIGSWLQMGGRALNNYIFAANGRYQYIGAFGTYTRVDPKTIELKTTSFGGDGAYTIKSNTVTMIHDSRKNQPEVVKVRFEKSNTGSAGWVDRLYIYRENPPDGGKPYEVGFDRSK